MSTPLRAHPNKQHQQHKNPKSKVSRLIWGLFIHPSFQIFHGTHHHHKFTFILLEATTQGCKLLIDKVY
jgi:hypothetical protein